MLTLVYNIVALSETLLTNASSLYYVYLTGNMADMGRLLTEHVMPSIYDLLHIMTNNIAYKYFRIYFEIIYQGNYHMCLLLSEYYNHKN